MIPSPASPRRPRVLLVAESANPKLTSVALIGWSFSRALAKVADVHLASELRNRADIESAGTAGMEFTPINNRRWQGMAWNVAKVLRGGTSLGWSTYSALATLAYPAFERRVWRQFGGRIARGEFDVVHRITPNAPVVPSLLATRCARAGVPFVLGPINGGVPWPKEFAHLRRAEREWLSRFRNAYKLMPGFHATRRNAAAILVGARFAWDEMPARYHDQCIFLPENAIDANQFTRRVKPAFVEPLRVAFVGRLVPLKAVDMLLEAAAPLARAGAGRAAVKRGAARAHTNSHTRTSTRTRTHLAQLDALVLGEVVGQVVHDALVKVVAAQVRVAAGRQHLEHAVADLKDGDVEGAAAQVEHQDGLVALLLKAVGERRRGRLVDDAQHLQAGDLACVCVLCVSCVSCVCVRVLCVCVLHKHV